MSSLLRSTKFVRYFAGAARTLILNSAKTAEANLLINSKALCVSNNVLMRDYATSKKTESLEPLLQRLDADVRRFGRISKRDIDEVFDELRGKHDITSSQSLLIIRCCGELVPEELPEQRTLLVQKIWSVLTERGVPMDISHYNALLRVYIENEHPFSPAEFLNELEKKGLQPNRVTYQRLMWRYCQEGDVEGATKVLEKMRELGLPVSEPVLNALVMGHAFHGDTDGAKAVLETMAGAGLQPSNRTYALLACGFAKKGDLESVEKVLKDANDKDAYVTDKDILDIMESLVLGGHGDKIESLFGHLQKGPGYIQEVCNLIIRLINKGHESVGIQLMKTMPIRSEGPENTLYKGAFFIKQLLRVQKSTEAVVKTCRELQQDNVIPNALYIAAEGALQQGNSELSLYLFKELKKDGFEIRQHFYWPLLVKKAKENDEEGLLYLLREMCQEGFTPTGECLRDYVIPYLAKKDTPQNVVLKLQVANIPKIPGARNVMVDLLEKGKISDAADIALEYRPFGQFNLVGRPLINALAKTKDIKSFVTVLHVISSKMTQAEEDTGNDDATSEEKSDANAIGRIVLSAVKVVPETVCEELLSQVHSKGLSISTSHAEGIEAYLGKNLTEAISEKLAQLTSSELEIVPIEIRKTSNLAPRTSAQLEKLIEQAKSKGGTNLARLQKQLLMLYVQENNLEKVDSFLKELESQNFELTNAALAMLCEFYAVNGDIEKSLSYKQALESKEPEFLLNRYKLVIIATALVKANRFDEAVKFLKESRPDSHDGVTFALNSKCWQLLNSLAESKDAEKVKALTHVLLEANYIEPTNVLLGPSIKVHLLNDDIEGALKEFEHCCKQYRSTPWKGELMKALILKEDAAKLQWLADLSTQIHGEVNILHDLVLAFVECGRLRQARRILETPGMQTRQKRLQDACERYVQEGKSEYLEGLLEATKELSYIDRANIFYHLLQTYCKADDTDKALGLWTLLQEEGEVPSEDFLNYLGNHLKSKNRPVPFAYSPRLEPTLKQNKPRTEPKQTPDVSKRDSTEKIEALVNSGKLTEAMDVTIKSIQNGVIPKSNVMKFMLRKLAEEGNVELIENLGSIITGTTKRNITYDDKLTLAIFVRGDGSKHVDELAKSVEGAKNDEELGTALIRFPRSNALASIVSNEELISKCQKVAEIAASKGETIPANLLWMEYLLAGKENEANKLWDKHLKNAKAIAYRRLLQECHTRNQPQLIEKVISSLKTNSNCTGSVIGNVYSRLINLHLTHSNTEDARLVLEKALADGCTLENLTKNTLKRLKESLETVGQEFKYTIP